MRNEYDEEIYPTNILENVVYQIKILVKNSTNFQIIGETNSYYKKGFNFQNLKFIGIPGEVGLFSF